MNESLLDGLRVALAGLGAAGDAVLSGGRAMDAATLHEVAGLAARVENAAASLKGAALAHAVCVEDVADEDGTIVEARRPLGHVDEFSAGEAAISIRASVGAAGHVVGQSAAWVSRFPRLAELACSGEVSQSTISTIVRLTRPLTDVECGLVEEALLPILATLDPGKVAGTVRRLAEQVGRASLEAAARANQRSRCVRLRPDEDGMTGWEAWLPTEQSAILWSALTTRAKELQDDARAAARAEAARTGQRLGAPGDRMWGGLVPSLDEARADALLDLALTDVQVTTKATLGIPVVTSTGGVDPLTWLAMHGAFRHGDSADAPAASAQAAAARLAELDAEVADWDLTGMGATVTAPLEGAGATWVGGVEVPSVGWIPPYAVSSLLTSLPLEVSRALLATETGVTCETTTPAYRTPARMRAFVATRDGTCRFPGCTRPAQAFTDADAAIDLDHDRPWPLGSTTPRELSATCRRHHRTKQQKRWRHALDPGTGEVTWTTPHGRTVTTLPVDHLGVPLVRPSGPPGASVRVSAVPDVTPSTAPAASYDPPSF